jgi:hypothetical protein
MAPTDQSKIDGYLRQLARALASLKEQDRTDIVDEIRAHLEQRRAEGRLDEAISGLGAPETCAAGFLEELRLQSAFVDPAPGKTVATLAALASRRLTAAVGLFLAGTFYLLAAGFAVTMAFEVFSPETTGLWFSAERGVLFFGAIDPPDRDNLRELLGRWNVPVSAALAVLSLVIGDRLGRVFIRLMRKRRA